jgi:hypothetical protein
VADFTSALPERLRDLGNGSRTPVLVLGADANWRHRVSTLVQAAGLGAYESAHSEAALPVARRVPLCAVVVDLVVGGPGIVELLAEFQAALGRRSCTVAVPVR